MEYGHLLGPLENAEVTRFNSTLLIMLFVGEGFIEDDQNDSEG